MIHFISTILVSTAMLVHGLFGCCSHHAHNCNAEQTAGAHDVQTAQKHEHSHHQEHADHSSVSLTHDDCSGGEEDHQDHPSQTCEEGQCTFVASENVNLLDGTQSLSLNVYPLHCDQFVVAITHQGLMPASGLTASLLAQPLCAQPMTQVWLL